MTKISALVGLFVAASAATTQAQVGGGSLMAEFRSTQVQIKNKQELIDTANKKLGKLRGALRVLGGNAK
jgi:hypothetical protein